MHYRNSTIVLAVTLLFVLCAFAVSDGHKKTQPDATRPTSAALQQIGSVPSGSVPVQSQIVDVRLWATAHDSKALLLTIAQAVKNGEMKTTKTVDATLQKVRDDIGNLAASSRCPEAAMTASELTESAHGPVVGSALVAAKCTCTWTVDGCGRGLLIIDQACAVHGPNSNF